MQVDEKHIEERVEIRSRSLSSSSATDEKVFDDEKRGTIEQTATVTSFDSKDADEALQLVGTSRTQNFSEEYNLKLRRKLDLVIPPLCAAVYFTQFLDKNALNYASIMGFPITGQDYNLVALAFYLGFFIWEFPTVYIAQKLRLGKYLGINVVLWGIILMLQAVPTSFGPFFLLRILLGMLESCVAPILILIISMFYKKDEQARRISWFYVMNGLTSVFGGFVAYGISFDSNTSFKPYRILYLLLGALAITVGVAVLLWMPDSPVYAKMLTREERIAALERVRDDQVGTENRRFKRQQVYEAFADVRTWLIVLTMFLTSIPNGGLSNFSAIIVKSFGYTTRQTLILGAPGGIIGALSTLGMGYFADRTRSRMMPIVVSIIPTLVGAAMLIGLNGSGQKGALLFATYIIGFYGSSLAIIYAYNASNTAGHTKKATINAITLATFAAGNIVGSETFLPANAPGYIPGKIAILVLLSTQLVVCFLLRWINIRLNKKKREALRVIIEQKGWSEADVQQEREKHAFLDLTDKQNPFFIYTP